VDHQTLTLWQEYTMATGRYINLLIESHKAGQPQPANLARFEAIALQAAAIRHNARQALRDHAARHPAQQCA